MLWERDEASLTCERVIPYHDGFEIELRRNGLGPQSSSDATAPRRRPNRQFIGLQIRVSFADGREELLDDVERPDREGPITLSAFGRRESGDDTLWLWVMPLPPPGEVRMTIEWPTYGIDPVSVSFDGADARRRRTALRAVPPLLPSGNSRFPDQRLCALEGSAPGPSFDGAGAASCDRITGSIERC